MNVRKEAAIFAFYNHNVLTFIFIFTLVITFGRLLGKISYVNGILHHTFVIQYILRLWNHERLVCPLTKMTDNF